MFFLSFCRKSCPHLGRWLNSNLDGQFVIAILRIYVTIYFLHFSCHAPAAVNIAALSLSTSVMSFSRVPCELWDLLPTTTETDLSSSITQIRRNKRLHRLWNVNIWMNTKYKYYPMLFLNQYYIVLTVTREFCNFWVIGEQLKLFTGE